MNNHDIDTLQKYSTLQCRYSRLLCEFSNLNRGRLKTTSSGERRNLDQTWAKLFAELVICQAELKEANTARTDVEDKIPTNEGKNTEKP